MPKIQLTIQTTYLASWKAWQGLREVLQNGQDAEKEFGAKLEVDYYNGKVRVENDGCTLPRKAWLLGYSTKTERSDLAGQFGEGLKLGVLALVRAGFAVKIRSGSEVWLPTIEKHDSLGEDVLSIQILEGRKDENRVRVEIEGIDEKTWNEAKARFLFLSPPDPAQTIKVPHVGMVLLAPEHKGCIYSHGIYVYTDAEYSYGYDLDTLELDRDRKLANPWDLQYKLRSLISTAANISDGKKHGFAAKYYDLLTTGAKEIAGVSAYDIADEMAKEIAAKFSSEYGKEAVPVQTLAESADLEHLGKRGIVVSKALQTVIEKVCGTLDTVKAALKNEAVKQYSWHDLSDAEKHNITDALTLISKASGTDCTLDSIHIADFRSTDLQGLYEGSNGMVSVAKKLVSDRDECLATLVHEFAHKLSAASDGDKGHVAKVESLWAGIVKHLRA